MKAFFKDHSYDMVKMMLNQIAISIFGFSLYLASSLAQNDVLKIATMVFSIVFYLFLTYTTAWDIGYRDHTSVKLAKKRLNPFKGVLISLCANSLNLLLALLIALGSIPVLPEFFRQAGGLAQSITILIEGMYSGLFPLQVAGIALKDLWFVYFLLPIPALLVSGISYYLGVKDVKWTSFFNKQSYPESDAPPKQKKDDRTDD